MKNPLSLLMAVLFFALPVKLGSYTDENAIAEALTQNGSYASNMVEYRLQLRLHKRRKVLCNIVYRVS